MSELEDFKTELDALCDIGTPAQRKANTERMLQAADAMIGASKELQEVLATPGWESRISGVVRRIEGEGTGAVQRPVVDLVQQGGSMF